MKRSPFIVSKTKNSLLMGIGVPVMLNKMLAMVCIIDFCSFDMGRNPTNPFFQIVPISKTELEMGHKQLFWN